MSTPKSTWNFNSMQFKWAVNAFLELPPHEVLEIYIIIHGSKATTMEPWY